VVQSDHKTEPCAASSRRDAAQHCRARAHPDREDARLAAARVAMGGKVIFTPPCVLYGKSALNHTGWYENDFNVYG
jgi:hypothetical protein